MGDVWRLRKRDALQHWSGLEPNGELPMRAVPYKTAGPKYGYDGIRIDGSREFIDGVLARLRDLIGHENGQTRLELNYTEIADRETRLPTGNFVCYVRVHERGRESLAGAFGGL